MSKLNQNQIAVKIPLSQIVETGNVRVDYPEEYIEQLANSILKNGLLQPIVVRRGVEDENGLQTFELVAGHCRKRAFELLCKKGYDYVNIDACVKTGEKTIMQLIENVQRAELSATEKEKALAKMIEAGLTQKEIAEELSKPISWVSDILKGLEVRAVVENAGVDTSGLATKTLSQVRSIPKDELPVAVERIKENGGTVQAATDVLNEYREKMPEQMPQKKQTTPKSSKKQNYVSENFRITESTMEALLLISDARSYPGLGAAIDDLVDFAKRHKMFPFGTAIEKKWRNG